MMDADQTCSKHNSPPETGDRIRLPKHQFPHKNAFQQRDTQVVTECNSRTIANRLMDADSLQSERPNRANILFPDCISVLSYYINATCITVKVIASNISKRSLNICRRKVGPVRESPLRG